MSVHSFQEASFAQVSKVESIDSIQQAQPDRSNLQHVKRAKKQLDDEARTLTNRIALLKQEESKTVKRIEDTKKQAFLIFRGKQHQEQRQRERGRNEWAEEVAKKQMQVKQNRQERQLQKEQNR